MKIYIASSWKNQHAVHLLTVGLRAIGHEVLSFVEFECQHRGSIPLEQWIASPDGKLCFDYDTKGATTSDLVIYIGPSGCDAWAEVGAAWANSVPVIGLVSKGEQVGLMRRMVHWVDDVDSLFAHIEGFKL